MYPDLAMWCFDTDPKAIEYYAQQLAKAMQISYNMDNFGARAFGLKEEED